MLRLVLVTQERCPHCVNVSRHFLPKNEDRLSSIASSFTHVHLKKVGDFDKIPQEIKDHVKVAPQLYAIYADGSFTNSNPLEIKNVSHWIKETLDEAEKRSGPKFALLILLSESCPNCVQWKQSGDMDKFVQEQKKRYGDKIHVEEFFVDGKDTQTGSSNKAIIKKSLIGVRVPFVISLPYKTWLNPGPASEDGILQKQIYPAVADPRSPEGRVILQKWLDELILSDEGLKHYLVLSTSDSCPHCINWRKSGGEAEFKRKFSSLEGIVLVHNGIVPSAIRKKVPHVPSVMLVPKDQWLVINPKVVQGPHPIDIASVEKWITDEQRKDRQQHDSALPDDFLTKTAEGGDGKKRKKPRRLTIKS